ACNNQLQPAPEVRLQENADNKSSWRSILRNPEVDFARGRSISAFELITNHAGPTADASLFRRATVRSIERMPDVFRLKMKAIDVVKPAVPGLCDNGQAPPVTSLIGCAVFDTPGNHCVTCYSNAVRVCDDNRTFEKSALINPCRAGHFTIAVQAEEAGVNRIVQ